MQSKKKLLYITDQQEYSEHGTIKPLFHGYLKEYMDVNIVYFTKFKNSFQTKESDFVVPDQYKKDISCYLTSKGVDLAKYDYIFVRNKFGILKDILQNREKFGYKVGYRLSFPKKEEFFEAQKAKNSASFFDSVKNYFSTQSRKNLLSQCDIFLPTSKDMQDTFYSQSVVENFALPVGVDPARIKPYKYSSSNERNFIYVGTLDALRDFEKVLVAFCKLESKMWRLVISTLNQEFAREVIAKYPKISDKITILQAETLDMLMEQVDACDVGIAMLPNISIYSTSIPAKAMDYYTCAIPTLLSDNPKNRTLFSDEDAFFCEFKSDEIAKKLNFIIEMSEDEISKMGQAGQEKLLHHKRNYKIMAKELYEKLESL